MGVLIGPGFWLDAAVASFALLQVVLAGFLDLFLAVCWEALLAAAVFWGPADPPWRAAEVTLTDGGDPPGGSAGGRVRGGGFSTPPSKIFFCAHIPAPNDLP